MIEAPLQRATDSYWQSLAIDKQAHAALKRQVPKLLWMTGLPGAGKSTVAGRLAARLGVPYLDTGAMYRAVAFLALREGLTTTLDELAAKRVTHLMEEHPIDVEADIKGTRF